LRHREFKQQTPRRRTPQHLLARHSTGVQVTRILTSPQPSSSHGRTWPWLAACACSHWPWLICHFQRCVARKVIAGSHKTAWTWTRLASAAQMKSSGSNERHLDRQRSRDQPMVFARDIPTAGIAKCKSSAVAFQAKIQGNELTWSLKLLSPPRHSRCMTKCALMRCESQCGRWYVYSAVLVSVDHICRMCQCENLPTVADWRHISSYCHVFSKAVRSLKIFPPSGFPEAFGWTGPFRGHPRQSKLACRTRGTNTGTYRCERAERTRKKQLIVRLRMSLSAEERWPCCYLVHGEHRV